MDKIFRCGYRSTSGIYPKKRAGVSSGLVNPKGQPIWTGYIGNKLITNQATGYQFDWTFTSFLGWTHGGISGRCTLVFPGWARFVNFNGPFFSTLATFLVKRSAQLYLLSVLAEQNVSPRARRAILHRGVPFRLPSDFIYPTPGHSHPSTPHFSHATQLSTHTLRQVGHLPNTPFNLGPLVRTVLSPQHTPKPPQFPTENPGETGHTTFPPHTRHNPLQLHSSPLRAGRLTLAPTLGSNLRRPGEISPRQTQYTRVRDTITTRPRTRTLPSDTSPHLQTPHPKHKRPAAKRAP